jgi:hypothetical protein
LPKKIDKKPRASWLGAAIALSLFAVAPMTASAATIVIRGGTPNGFTFRNSMLASWTQAAGNTYSSVTIVADVCARLGGTATAIAYLTNSIGPGTTVANQIATVPVSTTANCSAQTPLTIFTGLTLPPGTYYLLFSNTTNLFAWSTDLPATETDGTGVTGNPDETTLSAPPAYPPSDNTLSVLNLGGQTDSFVFSAIGTLVAPAATGVPTLSTLGFLGMIVLLASSGILLAGKFHPQA